MPTRKRFKDYACETQIDESNLLSKGFAIGQNSRHEASRQKLNSVVSHIHTLVGRAKLDTDQGVRERILFECVDSLGVALSLLGELSRNNINVAVASNLLEDDLKQTILRQEKRRS
jgi:hypothetical protein